MEAVYEPLGWKKESETSYQPVSASISPDPSGQHVSPMTRPQHHRRSRVFLHWLWHFLSLLWLAPIITLLYLNHSHYVIGASVWCPGGKCNAESNSETAYKRAQELDRQDHDTNGALQFVSKALEVWFMFVATSLVYDLGILFAREGRGLPVGYLLSHLEFGDIRYIFSPLLWTSPWPHRNAVPEKRARILKLYIFAIITALLTILANLMGPSTAVLVLPTLQWIDTPHIRNMTFDNIAAAHRPTKDAGFSDCNAAQLVARNYSCTSYTYGPSMDQWAAQGISSITQAVKQDGQLLLGSSQEYALSFFFNATANGGMVTWVPSRQVMREMSHEVLKTQGQLAEHDPPEYPDQVFNNSLQTILKRQGPSLGFQGFCRASNVSDLNLDETRRIRCYTGWTLEEGNSTYTKCLRLGTNFDNTDYNSQFWLAIDDPDVPEYETGVGVYFADRAMYFNDTEDFGSGIKSCLTNDTSPTCDWDQIFSTTLPDELRNTSSNVFFVSYQVPSLKNADGRIYCEHVTYLSFPTYNVDTSPMSNTQNLVTLSNIEAPADYGAPIILSPDWYLAAWSVDHNATLDGSRQIVTKLIEVLPETYEIGDQGFDWYYFNLLHGYAMGQALSMVNYYNGSVQTDPESREVKEAKQDQAHPVLHTWATIHVWAYGLSGRTSKLGTGVVLLGSVCVLARFFLGLVKRVQDRSTVDVLAAAFKHRHQGEFEGLEEESHLAKVRYQVVEDGDGKQRFIASKRTSRWSHV
ncbi:MAG: hypothetical protein Q9210_000492 [Variospora velana]